MSIRTERIYRWRVIGTPQIGDEIVVAGRQYRVLHIDPVYRTRSGRTACLIKWTGSCKLCSAGFEFTSTKTFEPVATCPKHRRRKRRRSSVPSRRR